MYIVCERVKRDLLEGEWTDIDTVKNCVVMMMTVMNAEVQMYCRWLQGVIKCSIKSCTPLAVFLLNLFSFVFLALSFACDLIM